SRDTALRPTGAEERGAGRRSAGGCVAHLLRRDLQPGAPDGEGHAARDAEEILEEPARGRTDSEPHRRCREARQYHGRRTRHRAVDVVAIAPPPSAARIADAGRGPRRREGCSLRLLTLPALRASDADGIRRGPRPRRAYARRRTGGRPGGSGRAS